MKIDDIEIGEKYVIRMGGTRVIGLCYAVDADDARFTLPPHSALKSGRIPPEDVEPYTEAAPTIDEIEDYAESTSEAEEVEPSNGFECVWRVRCINNCGHLYYSSGRDAYSCVQGVHPANFPTESAALTAAEKAGWYVDAEKALCPECRDGTNREEEE